ncbi:MAG: replication-relaxation family protein [Microbacteriaceae bacterium]|jgi:hypothetical protein|nr:replication-relaxation family protein [Microbacteriaceae bacterium]
MMASFFAQEPSRNPHQQVLLELLARYRFMTTRQLAHFRRDEFTSLSSALRRTQIQLAHLVELGLLTHLERRIGGWQGGSSTTVWTLTAKGQRQLSGHRTRRIRPARLSTSFLGHHLAITETCLIIDETARRHHLSTETWLEPDCWRRTPGSLGQTLILKPDLALTVRSRQFEDHYFIEVDRDTENPARVLGKCQQYQAYQATGTEQAATGLFPAVIWLVPSPTRQASLQAHLAHEPGLRADLFHVLLLSQLPALLRDGPG